MSVLNATDITYSKTDSVSMINQENYFPILKRNIQPNNSRYIKQRATEWFNIRKQARVTGSTLNAAAGPGTLKQQQEHYDTVVMQKESENNKQDDMRKSANMLFGTEHEIDAIATLVSRVLPVYFPSMAYVEEGCQHLDLMDAHS